MSKFVSWTTISLLISLVNSSPSSAANLDRTSPGMSRFVVRTDRSWDQYTAQADRSMQLWFETHVWRMMVYAPYWNSRLSWYPNAWVYINLYSIPVNSTLVRQHPDWILRDSAGSPLYIPYECRGGSCPQYAADISNPEYRAAWIDKAGKFKAMGYKGFWIDDVNLAFRVSDGRGEFRAPFLKGHSMDVAEWQQNVTSFLQEIRQAFPDTEILHNSIWFASGPSGTITPAVQQQIESCDYVNLERGVTDKGLKGGNGEWSLSVFLSFIDRIHSMGRGVVLDNTGADFDYGLAGFYLISSGVDAVGGHSLRPTDWPKSLSYDLGEPLGNRSTWKGLLVRRYRNGIAIVNPPGSGRRQITLSSRVHNADQEQGSTVVLNSPGGLVAVGNVGSDVPLDAIAQVQ